MVRDVAFVIGLVLLADRVAAWQSGTYKPDWKGIGGGLLIGYAITRII